MTSCFDHVKKNLPDKSKLLFLRVAGSRGHNLNKDESSDWDYIGVFSAPLKLMLGVDSTPELIVGKLPSGGDYTFYEVRKFCRLLMDGNPHCIDTVFAEKLSWISSKQWNVLQEISKMLISDATLKTYLNYSLGHYNKIEKSIAENKKRDNKSEYHFFRILLDAERIYNNLPPKIWQVGLDRDFLLELKSGSISFPLLKTESLKIIEKIKIEDGQRKYKKNPKAELNDWLYSVRMTGEV